MEVALVWDSRQAVDFAARLDVFRGKVSLPINAVLSEKLRGALTAHHRTEVALRQMTFLYPKNRLASQRKSSPLVTLHFNHLEPRAINEYHKQMLHVFAVPNVAIDQSAAPKILSYNYEPSHPCYCLVAKEVPSNFELSFTLGHTLQDPIDLNECCIYLRLHYRFSSCQD